MLAGGPQSACLGALERWGVPGAVVGVLAGGEPELRAYGVADLEACERLRPDTTFRVASITKPFTATLALLLADEGLLALDEPLPLALPADGITPRLLLAHLGGFEGEAGDLARFGDGDDALPRVAALVARQRQLVPPGSIWSYCNAGYWAVGAVCAERSGTTYEEALDARVLAPLGLVATSFGEPEARGHVQATPGSPRHEPAPREPYPRGRRPSGGLVSNVPDLLRFAAFHLRDGRAARLRERQADTPDGGYAVGWWHEQVGGVDVWRHPGTYGGFQSVLALVPERDVAFAVLTNGSGGDAVVREVSDAVLAELDVRREPTPTFALESAELELLAGRYANAEVEATIAAGGPGLLLDLVERSPTGEAAELPRLEARPVGARAFALVGGQWHDERFDFVPAGGEPRFVRIASRLAARC